jgi:hypothetical protein
MALKRLKTSEDKAFATLVGNLFASTTAAHMLHLKVTGEGSYSQHKALGHYYEDVVDTLDKFIEAYQGTFGIIGDVAGQEKDVAKMVHDDIIWLNENRER